MTAAQAACTSLARSQRLPCPVAPEKRLPALSLWPGQSLAQLARCPADGKRDMSMPVSARISWARRTPMPGTASAKAMAAFQVKAAGSAVGDGGAAVGAVAAGAGSVAGGWPAGAASAGGWAGGWPAGLASAVGVAGGGGADN